jgi:hypothetical protein
MTVAEYVGRMRSLGDEMAAAGRTYPGPPPMPRVMGAAGLDDLDMVEIGGGRGSNSPAQRGGRGGFNPHQANSGPRSTNNDGEQLTCQVCHKIGHIVDRCWYMYDEGYVLDSRHVGAATNSYTVDMNWYTDTGATNHITGELEKLSLREKYNGGEQIHVANGTCMSISHVGETTIHTQNCNLKLNHVLHVPQTKKNLISIHRFTINNNVFLEYHPYLFS